MAEWSKAHAWRACIPQKGIEGSNPSLSAKNVFREIANSGKLIQNTSFSNLIERLTNFKCKTLRLCANY